MVHRPYPDLEAYLDYRDYFALWLDAYRDEHGRGAVGTFAELAGCSPTHVRDIVTGHRDLKPRLASQFAGAMELDRSSGERFALLVDRAHLTIASRAALRFPQVTAPANAVPPRIGAVPGLSVLRAELPQLAPAALGALLIPPVSPRQVEALLPRLVAAPSPAPAAGPDELPIRSAALEQVRGSLYRAAPGPRTALLSIWACTPEAEILVSAELDRLQSSFHTLLAETRDDPGPRVLVELLASVSPRSDPEPG